MIVSDSGSDSDLFLHVWPSFSTQFSPKMGWIAYGTPELEAKSEYRLVIGLCVFSSILMIIVVATRCYVRRAKLGLDDALVVLGVVRHASLAPQDRSIRLTLSRDQRWSTTHSR